MNEHTHSVVAEPAKSRSPEGPFFNGNAMTSFFPEGLIQRKCAACEEKEKKIQRQDGGNPDQPDVITGADPAATPAAPAATATAATQGSANAASATPTTRAVSSITMPKHLTLGLPTLVPPALPDMYNFDYSTIYHPETDPLQFNPPESNAGKPDYFSLTQPYRFRGVGQVGDRDFGAIQSLYLRNQDFASRILGLPPDLANKFSNTTTSIAVDNGLKGDFPTVIEKSNEGTGTHTLNAPALHFKLEVNQPDDPYEREADSMANKVIRREQAEVSLDSSGVQKKCAHCEEEEKKLQRDDNGEKGGGAGGEKKESTASADLEATLDSSKGKGAPMQAPVNSEMSQAFGVDFSGVRIHTDGGSSQMNKDLNAHAFTHGNDIYFNSGKFDPGTSSGKHLLAHELTHVVQQDNGSVNRKIQRDDNGIDVDIEHVSDKENVDLHNRGIDLPESGVAPPKQAQNANNGWNAKANGRKTTKRAPGFTGDTDGTYISHIDVTIHANADSTVTLRWQHLGNSKNFQVPYSLKSSPGAGICSTDCSETASSQKDGSHCTPLSPPDYTVEGFSNYLGSYPSATFVTWYLRARGIAFHYYDIPSFPASHGCTRMDHSENGAEWIYDNSLAGITTVTVQREASEGPGPKCWSGGGLIDRPAPKASVKKKAIGGPVDDPSEREADSMADKVIQRASIQRDAAGADTAGKDSSEKAVEDMLIANSFQTKWEKFKEHTDGYARDMYMEEPSYMSLSGGDSTAVILMRQEKNDAMPFVPDIFAYLEQSDVDAYTYGMDFSKRLRLIGQNEEADRAAALFRKGAEFHSFMKKPGDEDVLKAGGDEQAGEDAGKPSASATSGQAAAKDQLPASVKIPGTGKSSTNSVPSYDLTQTPPPKHDADEDEEVKLTPVENSTIDDPEGHPLPYADYLIVSLPMQRNLKASAGKPYLIRGTPEQAIVDGRDFFKGVNYVVMLDERVLPQIKYYVSPLEVVGVISNDEARYSVSDFDTNLFGSKGPVKINALFVNYEHTTSLTTMGVLLTDGFIAPPDKTEFFGSKVAEVSQHKEQFPVSPELKGQIFDPVDKLSKEGKTNEAASQLSGLTESAFALVSVEKKKEYIKTLTDAWTWESEEKAIVEIFKSVSTFAELMDIKDFLKAQKTWDGDNLFNKMIGDLDSESWSLFIEIGLKFDKTPYTLSDFGRLLSELLRQSQPVVYINDKGEPELIEGAIKDVEQAAKSGLDFLQGIWDAIVMLVTHPDKIIEGVAQLMKLIVYNQLAQYGYQPAVEYMNNIFKSVGKQFVAAVKGVAIMDAHEAVVRKVKWTLIWEVASWFIGVGEIKAGLKSFEIAGLSEKLMNATRVVGRLMGLGTAVIEEGEMANRMEKLAVLLSKESTLLKSNEEAMNLLSKLSDEELSLVKKALEKGDIPDDTSLLKLAKERPELEGIQKKLETLEKLVAADEKTVMTESQLTSLQKLITEDSDPMMEKLLAKEKEFFEKEATKPGGVQGVMDESLQGKYDVEVKVGDHTYRRDPVEGTWCRFTTPKCGKKMNNKVVDQNLPKMRLGEEPVYIEPRVRGAAIEDAHLIELARRGGWKKLPNWYPGVDGFIEDETKAQKLIKIGDREARVVSGADVVSIKSTEITDIVGLEEKITKDLEVLKNKKFYNKYGPIDDRIVLENIKGKELHLIFEKGLFDKIDTNEMRAFMKEMEKVAGKQGVKFKWFFVSEEKIEDAPLFFKMRDLMLK